MDALCWSVAIILTAFALFVAMRLAVEAAETNSLKRDNAMISNLSPREEFHLFGNLSESTQLALIDQDETERDFIKPSHTDAFCTVAQEGFLSEHIKRIGRLKAERMGEGTRKQIDKIIEELEQLEYRMTQDEAYRREELQKVEDSMC